MCRPHSSSATPPIRSRRTIVPIVTHSRPSTHGQPYRSHTAPRKWNLWRKRPCRIDVERLGPRASGEAAAWADISASSADRQLEHLANLRRTARILSNTSCTSSRRRSRFLLGDALVGNEFGIARERLGRAGRRSAAASSGTPLGRKNPRWSLVAMSFMSRSASNFFARWRRRPVAGPRCRPERLAPHQRLGRRRAGCRLVPLHRVTP